MIMQSAFFKLANIIPIEDAVKHLKVSIEKEYGNKGEKVINMNYAAVDKGITEIKEISVSKSWRDAVDDENETEEKPEAFETKKATGKGLEEYAYRMQVH